MVGSNQQKIDESETVLINQTQFGVEKPLFEEPAGIVDDSKTSPGLSQPKKKNPMVFILGSVVIVSIILLLISQALGHQPVVLVSHPFVTPSPVTTPEQDFYKARLSELQQDFRAADPTQTTLPFPPVSLSISLDEVKR